ncbi:MAG: hypothetical protein AAF436_11620 [Myxococcota bacterium]
MTRTATTLTVLGSLVTALLLTAVGAIYLPVAMPDRLFAAGLSFVPVWVLLAFAAIALKRARYRLAAFLCVSLVCAGAVVIHIRGLS